MTNILFTNFGRLDPETATLRGGFQLLVEDGLIRKLEPGAISASNATVIDLGGRTLMPGLIDCHVHINRWILPEHPQVLPSYMTARAGLTVTILLFGQTDEDEGETQPQVALEQEVTEQCLTQWPAQLTPRPDEGWTASSVGN